jgi:hypothetical protein
VPKEIFVPKVKYVGEKLVILQKDEYLRCEVLNGGEYDDILLWVVTP